MTALATIQKRKSLTIMGVNTGTSIDSLDLSVVRLQQRSQGRKTRPLVSQLLHRTVSFPPELRAELMRMATKQTIRLEQVALLDEALGEFIGRACRALLKHCLKRGIAIDCISSHGQTVRHHPQLESVAGIPVRSSWQIGSPERIATVTNRLVVSHFRQADTAVGREGAPITTAAVCYCLDNTQESRLLVNIGGIANFFYLPRRKNSAQAVAEDLGPGNMLLDQATQILFGKPFDRAGALAKSGAVNQQLLTELSQGAFFGDQNADKCRSTGREQFGADAIRKVLKRAEKLGVDSRSVLTTLTELTAEKIHWRLAPLLSADKHLNTIYLSGGGVRNAFLTQRLQALFRKGDSPCLVRSVGEIGINPDSFEATCYAVLGWMCLKSIPALSSASPALASKRTGAREQMRLTPILGRIIQPPHISRV
jgi:anhydro-N-acetylmuramic acid kinase